MRNLGMLIFLLTIFTILGTLIFLQLRFLNKGWWQKRWIGKNWKWFMLAGALSIVVFVYGLSYKHEIATAIGATATVVFLMFAVSLVISLPFSGIFNKIAKAGQNSESDPNVNSSRRKFLKRTAVAFPTVALGLSGAGLVDAHTATRMKTLKFEFANLPDQLNGLKILHLSDAHLGVYKELHDLEAIIAEADKKKPDIVLFTGDIADELSLLGDTLKIVNSLNPKYGAFASIGNHEYYRGIKQVLSTFDKGELPLLKSSGTNIDVNGANLYISGCDDPQFMGQDNSNFLRNSIETAIIDAPSDAFHLNMSHRPNGLDPASELGIDLVLAGHTHGGQVGIGGRSLLSIFASDSYLWGRYAKEQTQMYVSAGVGHWFPFRLGCPSEAPIIQLIKKTSAENGV